MDKLTTGILTYNDPFRSRVYYWIKPKVCCYVGSLGTHLWTNASFREYSEFKTYKVVAPGELTAWTS